MTNNSQHHENYRTMKPAAPGPQQAAQQAGQAMPGTLCLVIVLDVTQSMQPYIDAVRNALLKMLDILTEGQLHTTLGAVFFRDERIGEEAEIHALGVSPEAMRDALRSTPATGGGDVPESSLPAIAQALRMLAGAPTGAHRMVLHITDAPCHDPEEGHTARSVLDALAGGQVVYFACTPEIEPYKSFATATGGMLFPIAADLRQDTFESVLLSVAHYTARTFQASHIMVSDEVRKILDDA